MDKTFDATDVQAACEPTTPDFTATGERSCVPLHKDAMTAAANKNLDGCEQDSTRLTPIDELLKVKHWKPAEPQFCKEIAAHYGQSKRTIQKWFVDLREIAPWFSEAELRLSDDRYTPLAVELLGHRYFTGSKKKWAAELAERFTDRVPAISTATTEPAAIRPDVLPPVNEPLLDGDCPVSGSLLPTGINFLAALEEEEAELLEIEARELRLLGRMGEGLTRLTHSSAQWERTNQLRKQRLLRQTRLEAASLAVELEEEFENTLRETQYQIQRGNVPAPGKPKTENPQSQSA
ncbi:MAG: hypothetical protein HC832_00365 [Leptolyngbyaceae cyanobacterium RM1_405_57]|nr:hypothetical protein [Leptolyngbyaceae cyanobacterium RM1_405_57]